MEIRLSFNLIFSDKSNGSPKEAVPMDELLERDNNTDTSTHFALQNNSTQLYFKNGCVENMCQLPETYVKII